TYSDTGSNPSVVTTRIITSALSVKSTTVADGMGQVIQAQLNSDPQGVDLTDTTYDGLGRVASVSNPYRTTTDPTYGLIRTQYDGLGRVVQVTKQDGSISLVSYNGNCTTSTDEAGKPRKTCTDALGRLIEVQEPNPASTFIPGWNRTLQQWGAPGDIPV